MSIYVFKYVGVDRGLNFSMKIFGEAKKGSYIYV